MNVDTEVPANTTLFGISCNRQLSSSELLVRPSDVTRSMVQKAVVVIASQPIFVCLPFRVGIPLMYRVRYGKLPYSSNSAKLTDSDQLGVVTRAYFAQRSAYNYLSDTQS